MLSVVVIPIYKEKLSVTEAVSLCQVNRVLSGVEKVFAAPESLEFNYGEEYRSFRVVRFKDEFFRGKAEYSRLLLSTGFYEAFIEYKYMLIYQLDAFVFSDQLHRFCSMDFDYIGAPVWGPHWDSIGCMVGNGGFSLRKINTTIEVLKKKEEILHRVPNPEYVLKNEDLFFSYCARSPEIPYRTSRLKIAVQFAIEQDFANSYDRVLKGILPFGCHKWSCVNYHIWERIINNYGYNLTLNNGHDVFNTLKADRIQRQMFYINRYVKHNGKKEDFLFVKKMIDGDTNCAVWGSGKRGKGCIELLRSLRVHIEAVFDNNECGFNNDIGLFVSRPRKRKDTARWLIIITPANAEDAIAAQLNELGYSENEFIAYDDFRDKLFLSYIGRNKQCQTIDDNK